MDDFSVREIQLLCVAITPSSFHSLVGITVEFQEALKEIPIKESGSFTVRV